MGGYWLLATGYWLRAAGISQHYNLPIASSQQPSYDMYHFNPTPRRCHALRHQPPVALVGFGFAAQQAACLLLEQTFVQSIGHAALVHQRLEAGDVTCPVVVFAILREDWVCWSERRQMNVIAPCKLAQKVGQIAPFSEPSQLPSWVQPDVHKALHPVLLQQREEAFRRLLRETDSVQAHRRVMRSED